jgi:hypothetical protein
VREQEHVKRTGAEEPGDEEGDNVWYEVEECERGDAEGQRV